MISNILTNIFYSINKIQPDSKCTTFSFNKYKTEEKKIRTSEFKTIYNQEQNIMYQKDETYLSSTPINFNTKLQELVEIVNDKKYSDKLQIISVITKNLSFYIESGTPIRKILLDTEMYKKWCDIISEKVLDKLDDYMNMPSWFKEVDYSKLIYTEYTAEKYTKETFKLDYFFFVISGSSESTENDEIIEITREQINKFKKSVLEYIKYDLIREYTIIDFVLKILMYYYYYYFWMILYIIQ